MLHSLVPRSPINSNSNQSPNPISLSSAMRAKQTIDLDDSTSEHDDNDSFRKWLNLSGEASISCKKTAAAGENEEALIEGESSGLRLLGLLLQCAECVATDNLDEATDLLPEISKLSSPFGSSAERVAAYFAGALQARIISSCLGTYSPPLAGSSNNISEPLGSDTIL